MAEGSQGENEDAERQLRTSTCDCSDSTLTLISFRLSFPSLPLPPCSSQDPAVQGASGECGCGEGGGEAEAVREAGGPLL